MKAVYTDIMKGMDHRAITEYGIPSTVLMEHAAYALESYIRKEYDTKTRILIVCGPGNNGGDGFALARLLVQHGYERVVLASAVTADHMSSDEAVYATVAKAYGILIVDAVDASIMEKQCKQADLIVDAIFGTGLCRNVEGNYKSLIEQLNATHKPILSVDIPSGIHGDTGEVMGCAIHADVTITFESYKMGHLLYPGSGYQNKLLVASIDMPTRIVEEAKGITVLDKAYVKEHLPVRVAHSNKGTFGKALLIGGSQQMHGAVTLTAKSCLRSGVGTLTLFVPSCIVPTLSMKLEESMILSAPQQNGYFHMDAVEELKKHLPQFDYVIIGNGMGRNAVTKALVQTVLQSDKPCILDGDALFELGSCVHELARKAPTIITPHIKEMSYVSNRSVQDIVNNPIAVIQSFLHQYPSLTIVLKDQYTWLASNDEVFVNLAGNSSLAKGGSGDVLCGIIAGLYGQCKSSIDACCCGVYVHAHTADELIKENDGNSILANDIIQELHHTYKNLR